MPIRLQERKINDSAVTALLQEVKEALQPPKGKYYAVFIDYAKAFDYINRKTLIEKLGRITGNGHTLLKIIREILRYNIIQIDDGLDIGGDIRQTNGVMQGDPISPLFFNIVTADIRERIKGATLIMFADDMVLGSSSKEIL